MPTHLVAHLQFTQANTQAKIAKEPPSKRTKTDQNGKTTIRQKRRAKA
ncbi:MAG: hypothetical protein IPF63_14135 [Bacteroidetes bacterium]|nr:hypothetical protein [Bacteroidota bacterium]